MTLFIAILLACILVCFVMVVHALYKIETAILLLSENTVTTSCEGLHVELPKDDDDIKYPDCFGNYELVSVGHRNMQCVECSAIDKCQEKVRVG